MRYLCWNSILMTGIVCFQTFHLHAQSESWIHKYVWHDWELPERPKMIYTDVSRVQCIHACVHAARCTAVSHVGDTSTSTCEHQYRNVLDVSRGEGEVSGSHVTNSVVFVRDVKGKSICQSPHNYTRSYRTDTHARKHERTHGTHARAHARTDTHAHTRTHVGTFIYARVLPLSKFSFFK